MATTVKQVINLHNSGVRPQYIFFWGHQGRKGHFSQWFDGAPFTIDGITYKTAEHWMMASKARLFGDDKVANTIVKCNHPKDVKDLGRSIRNFNSDVWDKRKYEIVVKGNIAKFSQNSTIKQLLINTGNAILVEASPYDRVWGVGLHATDAAIQDPSKWRGENLLGFALMDVRDQLK